MIIKGFCRISWICQYLKNKARMLESSLYKSSRLVADVTLAPFLESKVQNFWNFFFASLACGRVWHGLMKKWIGLKNFSKKCSRSPIWTPGVSNWSSFKSRLTNPKSWRPQGPSTGRKCWETAQNSNFLPGFSLFQQCFLVRNLRILNFEQLEVQGTLF